MEFKRILAGKYFILLLVALLLLNCWFFIYQNSEADMDIGKCGDIYHEEFERLRELSPDEAIKKCDEYISEASKMMLEGSWNRTDENIYRLNTVKQLRAQLSHVMGYEDYISGIQENAKKLQSVSLFSKPGSFAYENTVKTAKDFSALSGVSVTMGHDPAVSEVFSDDLTEFLVFIPILYICLAFLSERKEGLYQLVHSTPRGRVCLAARRTLILFIASFISVLLLCGSKILLCGYFYHGLGEWGRALQSIPMFYNLPYVMNIGQFWIFHIIFKSLSLFLCGLVFWLVLSAISNLSAAFCVFGLVLGAEFALSFIPSSSALAPLRYANLMSYINYLPVFIRYLNIPFFGGIISGNELIFLLLPFLCLIFILLNFLISERKYPIGKKSPLAFAIESLRKRMDGLNCCAVGFFGELKKLFIKRKGIFILIIMGFWLMQAGVPMREGSEIDMYLCYYEEKYAGPITNETADGLKEELAGAKESARIAALRMLISNTENAPEGSWILPSEPYEALFTPQKYHYEMGLGALLFLSLFISPIFSQERQAEVGALLMSTPKGRGSLWVRKQLAVLLSVFCFWLLIYGSELLRIIDFYGGLQCLTAPCKSLLKLPFGSYDMSVGSLIFLLYSLRLLVLICAAQLCFCLSLISKKNSEAMVFSIGVLLIPAALAAIGSRSQRRVSLLLPLSAVDILPSLYPYLLIVILLFASIALSAFSSKAYSEALLWRRKG